MMSHLIKIYAVCKFSYFRLWYLTLLHSERPKAKIIYNFGLSECNRIKELICLGTPLKGYGYISIVLHGFTNGGWGW